MKSCNLFEKNEQLSSSYWESHLLQCAICAEKFEQTTQLTKLNPLIDHHTAYFEELPNRVLLQIHRKKHSTTRIQIGIAATILLMVGFIYGIFFNDSSNTINPLFSDYVADFSYNSSVSDMVYHFQMDESGTQQILAALESGSLFSDSEDFVSPEMDNWYQELVDEAYLDGAIK